VLILAVICNLTRVNIRMKREEQGLWERGGGSYLTILSLDSSVCVVAGYGLNGGRVGVRLQSGARDFSVLHNLHTSSGAHQSVVSYIGCLLTEVLFI
jgi:hypothetical protein